MKKFIIYQLDEKKLSSEEYSRRIFEGLDSIRTKGLPLTLDIYNKIYECEKDDNTDLDDLFREFNLCKPEGYNGHSLSTSDIVETEGRFFFCDSYGWEDVTVEIKTKVQVINRGYLTYALTNGENKIYGITKHHFINDWSYEGSPLYWSEVFVGGNMYKIHRRGINLTGASNEKLSRLHEQSKINLHLDS